LRTAGEWQGCGLVSMKWRYVWAMVAVWFNTGQLQTFKAVITSAPTIQHDKYKYKWEFVERGLQTVFSSKDLIDFGFSGCWWWS